MIDGPCPFCPPDLSRERLLAETARAIAAFDAHPVADGHALIIPRRHVTSLFDLDREEFADFFPLLRTVRAAIEETRQPDGYTIGWNNGEAAGQSVPHLHCHIIPRYWGDVPVPRGGLRNLLLISGPPEHGTEIDPIPTGHR